MPIFLRNFHGLRMAVGMVLALGLASCAPATGAKSPAAPPAPAASAAVRHPLQLADLPQELGGLVQGAAKTSETRELGVSVVYVGPGLEATVYLYDAGIKDISEELGDPAVVSEFQDSLNGYSMWVQAGWARDVVVRDSYVLQNAGRPQFLCAELEIDAKSGYKDSYLFLATHQGQFVKVRVIGVADKASKARAIGFARELGRILRPEAGQ